MKLISYRKRRLSDPRTNFYLGLNSSFHVTHNNENSTTPESMTNNHDDSDRKFSYTIKFLSHTFV